MSAPVSISNNVVDHLDIFVFQGENIEDIPKEVLMDCAHLVKANSIQGQFSLSAFRISNDFPMSEMDYILEKIFLTLA